MLAVTSVGVDGFELLLLGDGSVSGEGELPFVADRLSHGWRDAPERVSAKVPCASEQVSSKRFTDRWQSR